MNEIRANAARRAFYSDHPLCLALQRATGWHSFRLRELIAFVCALPQSEFDALMGQ